MTVRISAMLRVLPRGAMTVGLGSAVLAASSYLHLALAGRALDPAGFSALAVAWTLVLLVGFGLFWPIEQEVTRLVSARIATGESVGPVIRRASLLALGIFLALLTLLAAAAHPLNVRLLGGDSGLLLAVGGGLGGLAAGHISRGILSGAGHFGWFGAQLALDGLIRASLALGLVAYNVRSPAAYAAILAIAPLISVAATFTPIRWHDTPGRAVGWGRLVRGVGLVVASVLLAQIVLNAAVVSAKFLAPDGSPVAGALLSALILVRVPWLAYGAVQASLLSGLSSAVARNDHTGFRRLMGRALALVTALGAMGGIITLLAGEWLIRELFNAPALLGVGDFAWLALGMLAYLLAHVLGQGAQALGRHRGQVYAWCLGAAALAIATAAAVHTEVARRVEVAFALASVVAFVAMVPVLLRRPPRTALVVEEAPARDGAERVATLR